ncbi:Pyridoxamine 5'-phosphate oxidase-related FMN-binding [Frankia sp. Hr75.2]|nr:Pyridoxamine 5'-phosphate oxidase-related FMN-binding [Frankia sp. Hr75.2]
MTADPARGFHDGELAVQQRAGVARDAARLAGMLGPTRLRPGSTAFLAGLRLAALTARDRAGTLWISVLTGPPGFLDGAGELLRIRAAPVPGDPLSDLGADQPVGIVAIDPQARRRMRVNGTLISARPGSLVVEVGEAYGNCPQYIQERTIGTGPTRRTEHPAPLVGDRLDESATRIVRAADTFFLGTIHPERGADASHRGGPAGFVQVAGGDLAWPDYPGNNMFNSLGNLQVDDTAALAFVDFGTGDTVQLSGRAHVEWADPGPADDDGGTGRRVVFTVSRVVSGGPPLPIRAA